MIEEKVYKEITPRSFKAILVDGVNCTIEEAIDWADKMEPEPVNILDYDISWNGDSIEFFKDNREYKVPFYLVYISTGYITAYNKDYFELKFELKQ